MEMLGHFLGSTAHTPAGAIVVSISCMKMTIVDGLEALEITQRPRLVIPPDELYGWLAGEVPVDLSDKELACGARHQKKLKHSVAGGTTMHEAPDPARFTAGS